MPRTRKYIDSDVLTEARKRISHIYDIFDTVVCMFSGGKDSLVVMHLLKEENERRGYKQLKVVFRDEEVIPMTVINFVDKYRRQSWVDMKWYTVPLKSTKYILGKNEEYIQWDTSREWVREKPEWSISLPDNDPRVFDQYTMDAFVAKQFKGKICFVTGIRADESLIRLRAVLNKKNESYISKPTAQPHSPQPKNVMLAKPAYDWTENDIFKYLGEQNIPYCPIYDGQLWAGSSLRVSTPLHAESAKKINIFKTYEPEMYDRILQIWGDVSAQERYYSDIDLKAIRETYLCDGLNGVYRWIDENIVEKSQRGLALRRFNSVRKRYERMPKSYPLDHILKAFMSGAYKREITPLGKQK